MQEKIKKLIEQAIHAEFGEIKIREFSVVPPEQEGFGDYACNAAMVLAKVFQKSPMEIARALVVAIEKIAPDLIKKIDAVSPGFINISISDSLVLASASDILAYPDTWEKSAEGKDKTVILDYFALNIAKEPHVGHLRSAVIGDALKRILLARGYHTIADTHVGDWGTQFGILLYGYKNLTLEENWKALVEKDAFFKLNELYVKTSAHIKDNPELREEAKKEFAKLEQGDKENRKIWQWMVDISMKKLEESAKRLNLLVFEENRGESTYEDAMPSIVELALAKGVAKKTEDGAVIVDLTDEYLDQAVLIKSDGASTYLLRDLATLQYRKKEHHFWKNLYVVDNRQSHHFRQFFRVAELLGFEGVDASEHVEFGFMKLPEGAMSTRAGNTISLDAVLDEAEARARQVIQEKNPDLADADEIAKKVGLGAIKFFDLSHNRRSDVVFRWEDVLSFEGKTGPYIQYTHARLKSILRKSGEKYTDGEFSKDIDMDSEERSLMLACTRLPEAMDRVIETWSPHLLATYLFELAQKANEFYHSHPVLSEENIEKKQFLLLLVQIITTTLAAGLYLLGIDSPEEM